MRFSGIWYVFLENSGFYQISYAQKRLQEGGNFNFPRYEIKIESLTLEYKKAACTTLEY